MEERITDADDPDDGEIERIHEEAAEAARSSWLGNVKPNPYPSDSERAEIWDFAFRNAWAQDNH